MNKRAEHLMKGGRKLRPWRSRAGFSLVELLVAMVIGLMLLGGIYQVFISSTTSYSVSEGLSRLQENGRFAMHTLRNVMVGGGYIGCSRHASFTNTLNEPEAMAYDYRNAVLGFEAVGNSWHDNDGNSYTAGQLDTDFGINNPLRGSDILVVRHVDQSQSFFLKTDAVIDSAVLKLADGTTGVNDNDILMITDCEHASVFQVTNYTVASGNIVHTQGNPGQSEPGYPGNATKNLGHAFKAGAEILKPQTTVFFVRNMAPENPFLYRKTGAGTAQDIVEGVENMQIRYLERGEDSYRPADEVSDWSNVVSVRIGVLMHTAREIPRGQVETGVYDVDGDGMAEFVPPGDRRLRTIVSSTILLRNRLQ